LWKLPLLAERFFSSLFFFLEFSLGQGYFLTFPFPGHFWSLIRRAYFGPIPRSLFWGILTHNSGGAKVFPLSYSTGSKLLTEFG